MILTATRTRLAPSLVVPDEQSWTVWGHDPASLGLRPVLDAGLAQRLLIPERMPMPLAEALASLLDADDRRASTEVRPSPLRGLTLTALRDHSQGEGAHEHHGDHGDHGDMMAIEGEPSADGLVMEPIEFRLGPLITPLPGGVVADLTLDGDVVGKAEIHALLEGSTDEPDLLAPAAWRAAIDGAAGREASPAERRGRLIAVERERAVSHLAWLRAFGRLLGWEPLVERCSRALAAAPAQSAAAAAEVLNLVDGSRLLASRTRGRATLDVEEVRRRGLRGPISRAAGVPDDARTLDPLYGAFGFEPLVQESGDALARTMQRAQEAVQALDLAARAERMVEAGAPPAPAAIPIDGGLVEGPRGPLRAEPADGGVRLTAPGSRAALEAAGDAMIGEEWAAALVALASFDLSSWQVAG